MNKRFFYLISVFVTCLFPGFFAEVKADCTIDYYIDYSNHPPSPSNYMTLSGDDPEFPFINWARPGANEIRVSDSDYNCLYHLIGAIPSSIQYGDYSQPGTQKGDWTNYDVAPPLELNQLYIIVIGDGTPGPDEYGVVITGMTCEEEGFVLENTGTGEIKVNDVPLPPCSQSLTEFDRNVAVLDSECETYLKHMDEVFMGENSAANIREDCGVHAGLIMVLTLLYFDKSTQPKDPCTFAFLIKVAISFCPPRNSKMYAEGSSAHISLMLQSGGNRFKPALDNLALDIETDTAKTSSVGKNDFAVGHNPDTTLTVAACYEGSVTVDPTNPALSPVTLMKGQMVKVWSDRIGPITNIGQTIPGTILLLLDDGAM